MATMAYSVRGRVLAGAAVALLGSVLAGACGGSSGNGALGAGGEGGGDSGSAECNKDADCDDGKLCISGECLAECQSDKDCRGGQLCGDADVCVDCITDTDCDDGETCSDEGTCDKPNLHMGGATSTGGTLNQGGKQSQGGSLSGSSGSLNQGGTLNGEGGAEPSNGGTGSIGGDCEMEPIDPCVGLPHFTGSQIVDGNGSEFCDVPPFTLALAGATYYRAPAAPITASTEATFRVGWSATALHVWVEVTDLTPYPNTSNSLLNIWNGDNLEIFASPKTPAGMFNYSRAYEYGAFQVIAAPPGALPPAGQAAFTSTGYATAVPGAQYKVSATASGYTFEAQIPWTTAAPTAGMPMGFDAGLSDDIDGLYNASVEYRNYYALLYNASYVGNCTMHYEPYCDSRNWCHPTALQ
jgi:hypothetical protein